MPKDVPSEEIQKLLKTVYDFCVAEDESVRQRQLRQWRRLKLLWEGFSQVWYSEVAHDWRIWDELQDNNGTDQAAYDKPVNMFRAYLESIIAALSVTVPSIKCYPDDADSPLDLTTARAGDKIGQLVYRHNNASILWLHALFIYVTEGCVAFYNYADTDEKYGTYDHNETDEDEQEVETTSCPLCGYQLQQTPVEPLQTPQAIPPNPEPSPIAGPSGQMPPMGNQNTGMPNPQPPQGNPDLIGQELAEFNPDDDDAMLQYALQQGQELCPGCMQMMDPELAREHVIITRLVGKTKEPKTRICTEAYGGLNVRIPNYAKCQKDIPYIILGEEKNYVQVVEEFSHLHGNKELIKCLKNSKGQQSGGYSQYDEWARLSPQYQGEFPINVITVNRAWLRPSSFNFLDEDDAKKLKKLFPNGCKLSLANDEFASACNQDLDDHWTLLENPMSDYVHFAPLGQTLVSVQEITNDLISLILQTIEHGISQTFVDSTVVNLNAYEQTEVVPGSIFPATPKSGKSMSDGFYELRTATLSAEVMPFYQQIQAGGQMASGALPSIFGGQLEGSDTASEYSMSRSQALQRLQNTWKLFTATWKTMFSKIVPMYMKEVQHDERDVSRNTDGNFINTFILKSEMEGKIGRVELEASENLPMTWGQKKDLLMSLLENPNPVIAQLMSSPENLPLIHEALGLVDFYVPGEDDVIKCYDSIKELLNSGPIPTGDPMLPMVASVDIDPDFDNLNIVFEVVRKWAVSEAGQQAKTSNPNGYQNVLLYGKAAKDAVEQQMMQQQMQQQQQAQQNGKGATPPAKPNPNTAKEAPITGDSNVHAAS